MNAERPEVSIRVTSGCGAILVIVVMVLTVIGLATLLSSAGMLLARALGGMP